MSRHPTVFSPEGTPLKDRTVGELVAERPGRSRIFQEAGIDFCCRGGMPLHEACAAKGASLDEILGKIEKESSVPETGAPNPASLPPAQLAAHIVSTHHAFLRAELPRLHAMAERVAKVHGGHTPSLVGVFDVFRSLEEELGSHLMKEETVLFPAIRRLAEGDRSIADLDGPIACMLHEHDDAGDALARLRALTNGFTPPTDACNTWRALFAGLEDLESDLHRHIHLENAVLFPSAQSLLSAKPV